MPLRVVGNADDPAQHARACKWHLLWQGTRDGPTRSVEQVPIYYWLTYANAAAPLYRT